MMTTSAKNMTNVTMAGNMTKKMTNMTDGPLKTTNKTNQQRHQIFLLFGKKPRACLSNYFSHIVYLILSNLFCLTSGIEKPKFVYLL
jgi:hypothetical protein